MDKNKSIDGLTTHQSKSRVAKNASVSAGNKSIAPTATKTTRVRKTTKSSTKPVSVTSKRTTKSSRKVTPIISDIAPSTTANIDTTPTPESLPTPTPEPATAPSADHPTESAVNDFLEPTHVFDFDEKSGELKASSATSETTKKSKHKKEKKPVSTKKKVIRSIIITLLIILVAGIIPFVLWGNEIIAKITGGQGTILDLITFMEPTYEPLKTDSNGRTNILAFGTSGYNMEGDEGDGTHDGAQLTDSIMVISLNQDTGDIAMLSLPRDLKASPTCTATGKINEVYWCNGGGGKATTEQEATAANALMDEVSDILGIDFQYYAHLNWGSLVQIVDILGNIEVTLDEDIYDYYWTGAVFEAGVPYTINGEQALGLARARHGTASGDFTRGASQQKILIGIKNKLKEKNLSITDYIDLANTLGDNLRTNFKIEEFKTFAHIASEFDFDSMRQISLIEPNALITTGNINGISYVLPSGGVGYYSAIQDYVAKMLSNDPRVYEDSTILVLNGTGTAWLASNEEASLTEAGYTNIYADNAPEGNYPDKYALYVINDIAPGTKKMLEERYQTTARPATELPESISRDYDFVLILGSEDSTNNTETD